MCRPEPPFFFLRTKAETPSYQRLILMSSDRKLYEIDVNTVQRSQFRRYLINADSVNGVIQIKNVNAATLEKVIEYCNVHAMTANFIAPVDGWDAMFLRKMDKCTLFNVMKAASFLEIKNLLDLTCRNVAERIKDKTIEEVHWILVMYHRICK